MRLASVQRSIGGNAGRRGKNDVEHIQARCFDMFRSSGAGCADWRKTMERRNLPNDLRTSRRQIVALAATAIGGIALGSVDARADDESVTRGAATIHQEHRFTATRKRIYEVLTNAAEFQRVILLSAAAQGMKLESKPAVIHSEPGGAFELFGGYITGRMIELVPGQRIVQAWRTGSWDAGVFSIARFVLLDEGKETKLLFDHTGFPSGEAEHLAAGWRSNYWDPMDKVLRTP
jgi:activator of HSP90 ATPase